MAFLSKNRQVNLTVIYIKQRGKGERKRTMEHKMIKKCASRAWKANGNFEGKVNMERENTEPEKQEKSEQK